MNMNKEMSIVFVTDLQHTEQTAGVKVDRLLKIGKSHRSRKKLHFLVNTLESYSIMVSNTQD